MPTEGAGNLTIGYSTLAARAEGIQPPPPSAGAEVLVCVQGGPPDQRLPGASRVVHVPGTGVARSRNAAIDHAGRAYLLFCDDDVTVHLPGVLAGVRHLQRTGATLALGRATDPEGALRKRYPAGVRPLTLLTSARAATYEMLVDVAQVRARNVRFNERFGAGAEYYLGDEYIFIADLLRAGLRADAVPFVFGTHPHESSGSRWGGPDAHARALVLNHVFGPLAPAVRVAFGLRHRRRLGGTGELVRFLRDGATP